MTTALLITLLGSILYCISLKIRVMQLKSKINELHTRIASDLTNAFQTDYVLKLRKRNEELEFQLREHLNSK